ncbi:hypothetical protein [Methanosarcina horonobensis]|uniref:hypothetical protein n=1 Tax=Methanosarcina horonobensis TaxID=418008 RepID=UPI0022B8740E|nr:hypothetical protein [Methanosarcina horonobensis]
MKFTGVGSSMLTETEGRAAVELARKTIEKLLMGAGSQDPGTQAWIFHRFSGKTGEFLSH